MKIHALTTGRVRLKRAFLYAGRGMRRQLDLFLPGPWSDWHPIHCWAIEHEGRLLLVDTGEVATVRDVPFARFEVEPADELPSALEAAGLSLGDVDTTVVTHMHGDHIDGGIHVSGTVLVHDRDLEYSRSRAARIVQRLLRQPVPPEIRFEPFPLDGGPFGAFEQSRSLSADGRIVAVGTPGHTPGHVAVVCIDDAGRHVLLAGDATDTLEQLHARRPDAVAPKPAVAIATMDAILAHGERHPTIYLPSHDPESVSRLDAGIVLSNTPKSG